VNIPRKRLITTFVIGIQCWDNTCRLVPLSMATGYSLLGTPPNLGILFTTDTLQDNFLPLLQLL
ncbi:unnamed protein product, partial [Allacma fusca]